MSKRANGEGSTHMIGGDRTKWAGSLSYRDDLGQQKRRTVYGSTQREVLAKLEEARQRIEAGQPVKDAVMTVGAWLDEWAAKALAASDRNRTTKDLYAMIVRAHLRPSLGSLTLERLPSDVEAMTVAKRGTGLSASTSARSTACCARLPTSPSGTGW